MSMTDDRLETLRAQVAKLTGPARTRPLLELGQALADRYWRAGPGTPGALPYLNEAITVQDEAYGYFDPADRWRAQVASQRGGLYGARHLAHGSPESDRETGVAQLEEALAFPGLPPAVQVMSRMTLGQLYLVRVTRILQSPDIVAMVTGSGVPPGAAADADRAIECFQRVLAAPDLGAEAADVARSTLTVAEAMRKMVGGLGGGPTAVAMDRIMEAVAVLQEFHREQSARAAKGAGGTLPAMPSLYNAETLAAMDPIDRPVAVVEVPVTEPTQTPLWEWRRAESATAGPAELRRELRSRMTAGPNLFASLESLLSPDAPALAVAEVDDLVALATAVIAAGDANRTDHLLLAVALYLRGRSDPGGWDDEDGGDLQDAATSLLTAADAPRPAPAGAVRVMHRLGVLLDERWPFGDVVRRLTDRQPAGRPARRSRMPVGDAAVFVANPRGDLAGASIEAMLLRRTFYPRSVGLGRTVDNIDGIGTPGDVLAHLDASMLHLGCQVTPAGALELAGPAELTPAEITAWTGAARRAGGVAVLPPTAAGAQDLAEALLAAGFVGVIGWRRAVPAAQASLILFVLHATLVDARLGPAAAVDEVARWMRDPRRKAPAYLPDEYAATMAATDLTDETYRGALTYRGDDA
jgi:hypothetical protein